MYTVSRLGPAARIVPSLLGLAVMSAAAPVVGADVLVTGAYELRAGALAGCELAEVEVLLPLLPQLASGTTTRIAAIGRDLAIAIDIHLLGWAEFRSPDGVLIFTSLPGQGLAPPQGRVDIHLFAWAELRSPGGVLPV
jgi:hypothetical protein